MLKRELYLEKIRAHYDSNLIKVISGIRRSGKSTLMGQIIEEINQSERVLVISLEDYSNIKYLEDPQSFHQMVYDKCKNENLFYIFIDEIQRLKDFERVLASLKATLDCSIFVTGSNSQLLSGHLATTLVGRTIEFKLMPFTFGEALLYCSQNNKTLTIENYIKWGGMPQRFDYEDENEIGRFLENLLESIIARDIFNNTVIKDKRLFYNLLSFVLGESGSTISAKSITNYLKISDQESSLSTIYSYLDEMAKAYLVTKLPRFDIAGKKALTTLHKYYAIDNGFITLNRGGRKDLLSGPLETVVYNHLIASNYKVFIGKTYKGEVDFIADDGFGRCYIQVAYLLSSEQTIKREFSSFGPIKDNYPKYVISLDKFDFSQNGIRHLNLEEFLLGKVKLKFGH